MYNYLRIEKQENNSITLLQNLEKIYCILVKFSLHLCSSFQELLNYEGSPENKYFFNLNF